MVFFTQTVAMPAVIDAEICISSISFSDKSELAFEFVVVRNANNFGL